MRKEKKSINLFAMILGISAIAALLLFLFLNIAGNNFGKIQGYNSVFGITTTFLDGYKIKFSGINGVGLTVFILFLVTALFSGIFGNYKRGFFIASTIADIAIAIMLFTYHSSWIRLNCATNRITSIGIDVGIILPGIIIIVHAIANLVAFKLANANKR